MNIYFAASIRGGRNDRELYQGLIDHLQQYGDVLTEHIALSDIGDQAMTDQEIREMDMAWIDQCDVVVAEITQPSIGVGYEIGRAEQLGKKIIPLYRTDGEKRVSAMIAGNANFKTHIYTTLEEATLLLDGLFSNDDT